ncbi:glycosyltransferase family 4 protein [Gemmata sp. JC717]|uniref:glycosyltransferase family 4 protein n=1 Tax=Gemmata algarum TaxID=2975278 RepID=UPI0021BB2491|nr:glycosyltransferase family 4 protein [Gemmata algarum]MDY3553607.1 glycosyltransferase family 4 protein [Gemmata algarum]
MKLFFLLSNVSDVAAAERLTLLAGGLPRDRFEVTTGVLGPATGAVPDALRAAGVPVLALPLRHAIDFSGMRRLRCAVRDFNPVVLHAVGVDAVRAARLCLSRSEDGNRPRFVASVGNTLEGGLGGWLTARQMRRADRVIATGWGEAERYRAAGVLGERLTRISPAATLPVEPPDRAAFCRNIGAPADAQLIFAGGRLESAYGLKDATVAFDMMRYVSPDLNLVFTGDGPDRAATEDLGRALAFDDFRLRFTGDRSDLAAVTRLAAQVWVLCVRGGEWLALRAMAAGRPVLAFRTPELEEIIEDGETGVLVAPGDRAALATRAQELLADPEKAARIGDAGRARVTERFSAARFIEQHVRVYQELDG